MITSSVAATGTASLRASRRRPAVDISIQYHLGFVETRSLLLDLRTHFLTSYVFDALLFLTDKENVFVNETEYEETGDFLLLDGSRTTCR